MSSGILVAGFGLPHLRHHAPVVSPLPAAALAQALRGVAAGGGDARAALTATLLRDYHADGVALVDSGTSALRLAIQSACTAARDGAIVALSAFGCYDIATAAVGAGVRIVLYDLDPASLAPDSASLNAALQKGATAVVIAPLCGFPVEWQRLEQQAAEFGAILIEDAAQGHGASWQGRPLGSLGRLSVISFGRGKGWTGGGGGALLWRGGHAAGCSPWHSGRCRTHCCMVFLRRSRRCGSGKPSIMRRGRLSRCRRTAALALATRDAALHAAATRRERGAALLTRLESLGSVPSPPVGGAAGYLRFPLRLPGRDAAAVARSLQHLGVAASYPKTLAELPPLRDRLLHAGLDFVGAADLVRHLVTLPTHSRLRSVETDALVDALAQSAGRVAGSGPNR